MGSDPIFEHSGSGGLVFKWSDKWRSGGQ